MSTPGELGGGALRKTEPLAYAAQHGRILGGNLRGQAVARRGVALGFAGVEFDFAAVRAVPARDLFHPLLAAADLVQ